jgi:hypothetical protein
MWQTAAGTGSMNGAFQYFVSCAITLLFLNQPDQGAQREKNRQYQPGFQQPRLQLQDKIPGPEFSDCAHRDGPGYQDSAKACPGMEQQG